MILKDFDTIVFAGDSITDMGSDQPVGEGSLWDALGRSYVRIVDNMLGAYYPELRIRIVNSGINGNSSADLLARWQRDVLDRKPDWVSVCIGGNDCWRQFDSPQLKDQHIAPDEYESNLRQMIEMTVGKVKGIFIMSPYYMEPNKNDPMRARMDEYGAVCKKLAAEYGCEFIDLQAMFDKYFRHRHSSYIAWDRIHPNQIGATVIAREFLSHCGFDPMHEA